MLCKKCGEETTWDDLMPGDVCIYCFRIYDMDRFRERDTPQGSPKDTSHTQEESSPEPSLETPSEHTMISVLLSLLRESEDQEVREHLVETFAVVLGKSKLELELQLSLISADMVGR